MMPPEVHPSILGMLGHALWMMIKPVLLFGAVCVAVTFASLMFRGRK
jgi:hypothetical protein